MGPKQKNEIFHCYNGSGGSSRGVDGVYGEKAWSFFGGHEGHLGTLKNQNCQERSKSQNFDYMNPIGVETHVKPDFFNHGS